MMGPRPLPPEICVNGEQSGPPMVRRFLSRQRNAASDHRYEYGADFQAMAARGSAHAAHRIASILLTILPIRAVVDLGCAGGMWLRQWQDLGVPEVLGVDGDYVDRGKLVIDPGCFAVRDLRERVRLERQFDLVQCLEVAEHLPPSRAASLVEDIVALAPVALFSAAPPGQGGEHHVNEQPGDYWRDLFRRHDYVALDCLRPLLTGDRAIPAWYRYNIILYVRVDWLDRIAPFAQKFQLRDLEPMPDPSPLSYKLRKSIVRWLPQSICDRLARWNAHRLANI